MLVAVSKTAGVGVTNIQAMQASPGAPSPQELDINEEGGGKAGIWQGGMVSRATLEAGESELRKFRELLVTSIEFSSSLGQQLLRTRGIIYTNRLSETLVELDRMEAPTELQPVAKPISARWSKQLLTWPSIQARGNSSNKITLRPTPMTATMEETPISDLEAWLYLTPQSSMALASAGLRLVQGRTQSCSS